MSEVKFRSDFTVDLIDSMGGDMRVVQAARVSLLNDDRTDGTERLIKYLLRNGHWSPFEHTYFTFRSELPIFLARQVMRSQHKFNEMSLRYSEALPHFYLSKQYNVQSGTMKQGRADAHDPRVNKFIREELKQNYRNVWELYQNLLKLGTAREQAREPLPVSTYTVLYTTLNLRSLLHFVDDRTDPTAQTEAQVYANQILDAVKDIVPITLKAWKEVNT